MSNPRLAGRYAKSLLDLSIERNQLELVYNDIKLLAEICKSNIDFVHMLKSPVIKPAIKAKIIEAAISNKVGELTNAFLKLLISKAREYNLPEILFAFKEQYNKLKNIHQVKIATAVAISDTIKNDIINKITSTSGLKKVELESIVKEELIGGFTLEMDGTLIDASILRDLNDIKKQFKNNAFIHSLR
jgi:F-type H+-transporting ATPase subunit delta